MSRALAYCTSRAEQKRPIGDDKSGLMPVVLVEVCQGGGGEQRPSVCPILTQGTTRANEDRRDGNRAKNLAGHRPGEDPFSLACSALADSSPRSFPVYGHGG